MKKLFLSLSVLLTSTYAVAGCSTALVLESDDSIYPGRGEVQICTNSANQLTKLIIIKPVQNPQLKIADSEQADERNPVLHLTLEQINSTETDIQILTPTRMGVTVKAAVLEVPKQKVDKDKGGEVTLKVIKSKLAGSFHRLQLQLKKVNHEWQPYIVNGESRTPISHFFFKSGLSGIKKVEYH